MVPYNTYHTTHAMHASHIESWYKTFNTSLPYQVPGKTCTPRVQYIATNHILIQYQVLRTTQSTRTTHSWHVPLGRNWALNTPWYIACTTYKYTTYTGFVRRAVVGAVVTSTSVQVASNVFRAIWGNGATRELDAGLLVSQHRPCVMCPVSYDMSRVMSGLSIMHNHLWQPC